MSAYDSCTRHYRAPSPHEGETAFQVVLEQTDLHIVARENLSSRAMELVRECRGRIKAHIHTHPDFAASLAPVEVPPTSPKIIRDMAHAGKIAGVGPMAAVAGAVAQYVAEGLSELSPDVIVENGGDVFMRSTRPRVAALLADPEGGAGLGLQIGADEFPLALCASSGKIGHSLSLGAGDLVVVRARDAALADALATALGNLMKRKKDLDRVVAAARGHEKDGLEGVFAQFGEKLAVWGRMELVALGG